MFGAPVAETLAGYFAQFPAREPYSEVLVFGEPDPKHIALSHAERLAVPIAPIMPFLSAISRPMVSLLSASTELAVRLLEFKPAGSSESVHRSVLGALLIGIINNRLSILNVSIELQLVAKEIIIVMSLALDR